MQKKVIALGFFDGVHLAHGALLSRAVKLSEELGLTSSALLFDRHPSHIISKAPVPLINTVNERAVLMKSLYNIEDVLTLHFDEELASLSWDKFICDILIGKFNAGYVVAGFDFRFGARGDGNSAKLTSLCNQLGVGCEIISPVKIDDTVVSSSRIRSMIAQGDMRAASRFLGHNHFVSALIEHGAAIGRSIGIPTINQYFDENIILPHFGVYITLVHIGDKIYRGVTNVGICPTVCANEKARAETHILGYSGDLYGERVCIEFIDKLRDEKRFQSLDKLQEQIMCDILAANEYEIK